MPDVTHTDGDGTEEVFRLMYRSHSRIEDDRRSSELAAIFTTARRHNRELGITGALMINDDAFVQTLEGDETAVRGLFDGIRGDERHDQVSVLQETTAHRTFGRWAMAKVSSDDGPDIRLMSNARKGAIVSAPRDPSITADQEAVLATMRDALDS